MLLSMCIGCRDKEQARPDFVSEISALRNGQEWQPTSAYAYPSSYTSDNRLSLSINVGYVDALGHWGLHERLKFIRLPKEPGKFSIHDTSNREDDGLTGARYTTFLELGHVVDDFFRFADGIIDENYFEVIAIDEDFIEGRFAVAFIEKGPGSSAPDTVIFTNGYVRCSILK